MSTHRAFVDGIALIWDRQCAYAQSLVADLSPEEMLSQPVAGVTMNHPAWILSHLSAYHPVLELSLRGETPDDPVDHPYGMKSAPLADAGAYLPKDELVRSFTEGHDRVAAALRAAPQSRFDEPPPIARFHERMPTIAGMCTFLGVFHESVHIGQLSAWRRAGGRPPVNPARPPV